MRKLLLILDFIISLHFVAYSQVSTTSSKHFDCSNVHSITLDLGSNVQIKSIKGTRCIIEHTVTVKHDTKEIAVSKAIQASELFSVKSWKDDTVNQLVIKQEGLNKPLIADNKLATVSHSYIVYIPNHLSY